MIVVGRKAHDDWTRLWQLADRLADDAGAAFEDIGLFLEDPNEPAVGGGYDSSPASATMFASTGGDGVHFNLLPVPDLRATLVVMTVPMQWDSPNVVVGGDLREFLALGCATGYFSLEQLAYGWGRSELISMLQITRSSAGSPEARLLDPLIREFELQPWPDVEGRLAALEKQFSPYVHQSGEAGLP